MKQCIKNLRFYVHAILHKGDLAGYATRSATMELVDHWEAALKNGSKADLLKDVDQIIERLQAFRKEAAKQLPVVNGGQAGVSLDEWKARLAKKHVEIYPCPQHRIGRYGYTGCDDADYVGEEEAIKAAVAHYFG